MRHTSLLPYRTSLHGDLRPSACLKEGEGHHMKLVFRESVRFDPLEESDNEDGGGLNDNKAEGAEDRMTKVGDT
jgi:hypothetical protein